jgi:hypothetical protein
VWTIRAVASTADIPAPVDISGKANVDLDNLSAAGEAKILSVSPRYLTDSYYNATTGDWYRVYDDGWIEQGGFSVQSSTPNHHINFLKPFASANCTCLAIFNRNTTITGGTEIASDCGSISAVTATYADTSQTASLRLDTTQTGSWRWVAFGMGAQS